MSEGPESRTSSSPILGEPATQASARELLLGTKLYLPIRRSGTVDRRSLIERLCARDDRVLTLMGAPAGWGKTTLLTAWHSSDQETRPFAWLSLDPADNDPVRFWTYVVGALRTVHPHVGARTLTMLRGAGGDLLDTVLPAFVNEVTEAGLECVLVLDDYHAIDNPHIHDCIAFLLDHCPPSLHVVLATRSDPPLPLARLRARGQMMEMRAKDLQFTHSEATTLLNDILGLDLQSADVSTFCERTEGWAAGLYMAALSLHDQENSREFIDAFAGDDRHVVDYLMSEVLDRETEDTRSFLLQTSILERMCGPLCDAVTGRRDSAQMLERLERFNLFIVPLDNRRRWYRYHHLFGSLLVHELDRVNPGRIPKLHRRASDWYETQGVVGSAISHACEAGDLSHAADLIALHWNDFLNQGRIQTVESWLQGIPREILHADPRLCIARAGVCLTLGLRDEVEVWLTAAEAQPAPKLARAGASSIAAEAAIYRALNQCMAGNLGAARNAARKAVELETDDSSPWRAMSWAALGRTLFWSGDRDEAETALRTAAALSQPTSNNLSVIGALGYLSAAHAERNDVEEAEALSGSALRMTEERGFAEHWVCAMALIGRARVLAGKGAVREALEAVASAAELTRRGNARVELAYALLTAAELQRRAGDERAAEEAVEEARIVVSRCRDPGILAESIAREGRTPAPRRRLAHPGEHLSDRELAVLRLLRSPRSLREIGEALYLSQNTVKTHARHIYRKLDASTREEAIARARELQLL